MTFEESIASGLRIRGDEDTFDGRRHRQRYEWAAERLRKMIGKKGVVVDWGCGAGYGSRILLDAGLTVVGFDPDPEAVAYAKNTYGVVAYADVNSLPERASAIVCFEVIEHLVQPPDRTVQALMRRCMYLLGSVPYNEPLGNNPHHCWFNLNAKSLELDAGTTLWSQEEDRIVEGVSPRAINLLFEG